MAFATKVDYCGLSTIDNKFKVRDSNKNGSEEKYQPQGQDGSFVGTEVFGADTAPSNTYAISGGSIELDDGDIKLNHITTIANKNYALESVSITTGAASAPTISATAQEVEDDADNDNQSVYEVPAFTITSKQVAQILFGAFTYSGGTLTSCNATIGGSINKDKVEGVKVGSDINSGIITITGTILMPNATGTPTITATSGWTLTKEPSIYENNPESAYREFTFELEMPLAKTEPSAGE